MNKEPERRQSWTFLRDRECECGHVVEDYQTEIPVGPRKGEPTTVTRGCKCEDYRLARQAQETRKRQKTAKARKIFEDHSIVNRKIKSKTLADYDPATTEQGRAKKIMERYAETFSVQEEKSIYMSGSYGIGKTHLAYATAEAVKDKGFTVVFISVPKLWRKVKSTYNDESNVTEDQLFSLLEDVDLLVLDDLGAERNTDWNGERLFDLIDSRVGKNNIITSNLSANELMARYGEREGSRILDEETHVVEINGDNHRIKDMLAGGNDDE